MHFSETFKKEVIKKLLETGMSFREAGKRLNVTPATLGKWKSQFIDELLPEINKKENQFIDLAFEEDYSYLDDVLSDEIKKSEIQFDSFEKIILKNKNYSEYTISEKYIIIEHT